VTEVTKDIYAEFQKEGEEKRAGIEGRINYFHDVFQRYVIYRSSHHFHYNLFYIMIQILKFLCKRENISKYLWLKIQLVGRCIVGVTLHGK
jgi:hypothetical protein